MDVKSRVRESRIFISVILPVYNGDKYLSEAIQSILDQSLKDLELIIIDDCSIDKSLAVIQSFSDERIVLLQNKKNRRTAFSLNRGIAHAKGQYVARMDQDDIAFPNRLERQYQFMEANPHISVCGTQMETFGNDTETRFTQNPLTASEIQLKMLWAAPFAHPTVMFRRAIFNDLELRYNEEYIAEGLTLWSKILLDHKSANLPDVLLKYRIHKRSITKTFYKRIRRESKELRKDYAKKLFKKTSEFWIELLFSEVSFLRRIAKSMILKNEFVSFHPQVLKKSLDKLDNLIFQSNIWRHRLITLSRYFNAIK